MDGIPRRQHALVLSCVGAGAAVIAMLVRELAVLPVLGIAAALVLLREPRYRWTWTPWAGAILLWIGSFLHHAAQVRSIARNDAVGIPVSLLDYWHPGTRFLAACLRWAGGSPLSTLVVVCACAAAVNGVRLTWRTPQFLLVAALTLGPLTLLLVSGTPGVFADGSYTGYWGYLFIPIVVAWAPTGLQRSRESKKA
jgi:hypothetical protein